MSQATPKPSLSGVRIRTRKGAAKAQAKHEPQVFRDQLFKHLETVDPNDFEAVTNKLLHAGSTLEYAKYADSLFEIVLVGGLLQPGGTYIDDGAAVSPFALFNASEPPIVAEIRKYIEVLNKVIRRYKYLQKTLEEVTIPSLLQYIHRWEKAQREKLALAIGIILVQQLSSASCLAALKKDHLVKDDVAIDTLTKVIAAYTSADASSPAPAQTMEQLGVTLKKGGLSPDDILDFFPAGSRRGAEGLESWFKENNLSSFSDWWKKRQVVAVKERLRKDILERVEAGEDTETIIAAINETRAAARTSGATDGDLVPAIWAAITGLLDWDAVRPDQIDGYAVREVQKYAPLLEPYSQASKTQIALINLVQVYCYENTKVMKTFPQILKVLYNADCISGQGIIYWYSKGSKPDGRQHFLKATEPLVKVLQEQEDESDEE